MKEQLIKLKTDTKTHLALWKITSDHSRSDKNILLTHGTFSNRKVLNGITAYLVKNKYTCWIFEWRNHGHSTRIPNKFDFETIGEQDFKYVFNYLFDVCKIKHMECVTHSGGGICLTIALINNPNIHSKINSISMFACQAYGASDSILNFARIYFFKYASKLFGFVPAKKIGGEENESYYLMRQWFDWNLKKEFIGKSGINYQELMKSIKIPILSIYGAGDKIIAPSKACQTYLLAFENTLNKSLFCSKSTGYTENYNHSRILHSRNARKEIYPKVLEWMNKMQPVIG